VAQQEGPSAARELYDHQTDPQENENVAEQPANAPVMERLAGNYAPRAHWPQHHKPHPSAETHHPHATPTRPTHPEPESGLFS